MNAPLEPRIYWDDVRELLQSTLDTKQKYAALYDILDRVCRQLTAAMPIAYSGLFSQVQALCRTAGIQMRGVDTCRWRARQVRLGRLEVSEADFAVDCRAFAQAMGAWLQTDVPADIRPLLPVGVDAERLTRPVAARYTRLRLVADHTDAQFIYAKSPANPDVERFRIDFSVNAQTRDAARHVRQDTVFNALDCTVSADHCVVPTLLILEPDYLVDVSTLTSCLKPYGASPYQYLLKKLELPRTSHQILLGAVANQFLDDCTNCADASFERSIRKCFRDNVLDFCTTDGVDETFFANARQQFANIRQRVDDLKAMLQEQPASPALPMPVSLTLEPSFFCEALGLQGRFDMLATDGSILLELKSGKMDEFRHTASPEHMLQMLLYKEILHYNLNLDRNRVRGLLFYSRYPYIVEQRSASDMLLQVLTLRNQIVLLEHMLHDGKAEHIIQALTPEHFKTQPDVSPRFWQEWGKPAIEATLRPWQSMDPLLADYVYTFFRFIEGEQMLDKLGDRRIGSSRGMANLWNADTQLKRENGDIITGLKWESAEQNDAGASTTLHFALTEEEDSQPNFRLGDSVILYPCTHEDDNATRHQLYRCSVADYAGRHITLQLRHAQVLSAISQQNPRIGELRFAVEHDYVEAGFRTLYSGLSMLIQAPRERRDLLLCQRKPQAGADYELIVGPPGTGKTSVTLRNRVAEAYARGETILLCAYTNRAVDEICETVEALQLPYIRFGRQLSCDPSHHAHLFETLSADCTSRADVLQLVARYRIVVATVATLSNHLNIFQLKTFDIAFFDEASQILEPQILPLLCASTPEGAECIRRFVLIGDHKQLPAVAMQDEDATAVHSARLHSIGLTNCRNSLFERLHKFVQHDGPFVQLLDRQGRMHPAIAAYPNAHFYDGKLQPVQLPHQTEQQLYATWSAETAPLSQSRMLFLPIPSPSLEQRKPKMNEAEAAAIARVVALIGALHRQNNMEFQAAAHIGIIVPFRRQIATIRQAMARCHIDDAWTIMIDTVERYQGSQKDFIIYGTTISRPYEMDTLSNVADIDGNGVDRKLNVAITRARKQFILVGAEEILERNTLYAELIQSCQRIQLPAEPC